MKKRYFIGLIVIFILIIGSMLLINYKKKNSLIGVYLDNIESTSFPEKNSNYVVDKVICDNDALASWDNNNWSLFINNVSKRSNCKIYFRSKKDITITYDNNYVKDNKIDEFYDLTSFSVNCNLSSNTNYSISRKNGSNYYVFTSGYDETTIGGVCGFYKFKKELIAGAKYSIRFIAKGNSDFNAYISSELDPYLYNKAQSITTQWQKYTRTFTAISNDYKAFVVYGWLNGNEKRILELTNVELQEGEYDNFSTINLKEYDTLSSTLPTPTRDNYTFLGWYTDPIEGEKISAGTQVTDDTTYYAHWQYNE